MKEHAEQHKALAKVIAKAWSDEDFKKKLLADPNKVLAENDIDVPAGLEMKVVENTDRVFYFVLPAMPAEANEMMLEERIAASDWLCVITCN